MKQNAKYIIIAVAVVIIIYLGFDLLKPYLYPCESIFQQTTTQIGGNMETIQAKGDLFIGAAQIQELTERSQMLALNLKTCCTLTDQNILSSEEFLACKGNADAYIKKIKAIAQEVDKSDAGAEPEQEINPNEQETVNQKTRKINTLIKQSETNFEAVSREISIPTVGSDAMRRKSSVETETLRRVGTATTRADERNATTSNNTFRQMRDAKSVAMNQTISANILDVKDVDFYKIQNDRASGVKVQLINRSVDLKPEIMVFNSRQSRTDRKVETTPGADLIFNTRVNPGDLFYVRVSSYGDNISSSAYSLKITAASRQ